MKATLIKPDGTLEPSLSPMTMPIKFKSTVEVLLMFNIPLTLFPDPIERLSPDPGTGGGIGGDAIPPEALE